MRNAGEGLSVMSSWQTYEFLVKLVNLVASLLEQVASTEHSSVRLHGLLHVESQLGCGYVASSEADLGK